MWTLFSFSSTGFAVSHEATPMVLEMCCWGRKWLMIDWFYFSLPVTFILFSRFIDCLSVQDAELQLMRRHMLISCTTLNWWPLPLVSPVQSSRIFFVLILFALCNRGPLLRSCSTKWVKVVLNLDGGNLSYCANLSSPILTCCHTAHVPEDSEVNVWLVYWIFSYHEMDTLFRHRSTHPVYLHIL